LEIKVSKFYLLLWLRWAFYVTLLSTVLAVAIAAFTTVVIYYRQGGVALTSEVYHALIDIFRFWFGLVWSLTLLAALFLSLKSLFNHCFAHFKLVLLSCPNESKQREQIAEVGYGDLIKVWRKWFMLLIWLVGAQMIVAVVLMKLLSDSQTLFSWFNIYILYMFVLIGGYFSFIILSAKCKKVKVVKC
jgi:hypothetical protein